MSSNYLRSMPSMPPIDSETEKDGLFVQSIARAMDVLSIFHQVDRPLSLQEISSLTGLGRSNVQRILFTLRSLGYITRDPDDRGYVPGLRLLDHSLDFLRLNPVVVKATPILLELRRAVRERVDLSIWDDLRLVYASRLQSKREILTSTFIGYSVPVFCVSGGWAILAQLEEAEADSILTRSHRAAFTPKTLTDLGALKEKIRETREAGYATALEQVLPGEIAIGAAILDQARRPVAAIHVAGSLSEWTPEDFTRQFAPLLVQAARTISRV
ncbi:IclR family pca regulon transcriptional regulator [Labrenzia sp. MBR-25]